ncbi:MAG: polyprenyl synthetase family protein, partial [Planctomycetaceae bacterium]|nr:polyprenyl synthetase family protein [Planctomycetaceae bacterium]
MDTPERPIGLIDVPCDADVRNRLRARANGVDWREFPAQLRQSELAVIADDLLKEEKQPAGFRNWLMVILASSFWRDSVAAVPYHRRLLLLPSTQDPGNGSGETHRRVTEFSWLRPVAEGLGYRIMDTNHLSLISQSIGAGEIDAVVGVSNLQGLEKAVDHVMAWGIPCMAEPLLEDSPELLDQESVERMIRLPFRPRLNETNVSYNLLMREARELFRLENLDRLVPRESVTFFHETTGIGSRNRSNGAIGAEEDWDNRALDPLTGTANIAYEFLSRGGKYFRPFITLATYNALTMDRSHGPSASNGRGGWSTGVQRTAMSIEVFHKASLVHDDIEDNDDLRYGEPAIHKRYGTPTAINVGDYLVGLGYRLVSGCKAELGGDTVADLLDCLASAHQRLSEGQGAELLWRDSPNKFLTPTNALKVYALKTAPAFEVAFYSGLRLAGPVREEVESVRAFSEHLGVAFQILNDLQDWCEDDSNKGTPGGDILQGRPTLLWALALQASNTEQRARLISLVAPNNCDSASARI